MTEIFTARSVEEAKDLAAKKFGKKISEIRFEIIDEGKKGLFGLGAKEAKVKATVADQGSAAAQSTAPKTTTPAPKAEPVTKTASEEKPVVTTETKAEPVKAAEPVKTEAQESPAENVAEDMEEEAYSLDNFTLIEDEALINPKVKLAKDYITSILRAMDVDAEFVVYHHR